MKRLIIRRYKPWNLGVLLVCVILGLGVGSCTSHVKSTVVSQQTIYPYHFQEEGSQLNAVGRYDMSLLMGKYRRYAGSLYVFRGDASSELYEERVQYVVDQLKTSGVEEYRINVADKIGKMSEASSERVIRIAQIDKD